MQNNFSSRVLVLGAMPQKATPHTHMAAGAWCFSGQEKNFPDWWQKGTGFPLPPDPYPTAEAIHAAAKSANAEVLRLSHSLGEELGKKQGHTYSSTFWEMALGPWLILCVHMLAERQRRVQDLVQLFGQEKLEVPLVPEASFSFQSTLDFMVHGVQDIAFNHYIYSRIVEALAPPTWTLTYLPAAPLHQARSSQKMRSEALQEPKRACPFSTDELRKKAKTLLRNALRALPFPRQKGFSPWQTALFSLAVLLNKGTTPNAAISYERYCQGEHTWHFPALPLIQACMPRDLAESSLPAIPVAYNKLRGMTSSFSQDDTYRLSLAAHLEGGGRLFSIQHGANYANLQSTGIIPIEYQQHAFFSWGWSGHEGEPVNAIPMVHPSLAALRNSHKEQTDSLILVGTEMSTCFYRFKSRPQSGALPLYRQGKVTFFQSLTPEVAAKAQYRPYFSVAGGLTDAEYVLQSLHTQASLTSEADTPASSASDPHITATSTGSTQAPAAQADSAYGTAIQAGTQRAITLCTGDLTEQMQRCRLLVLDHYGTTLHMALAANIPTLCFWNREQWGMERETNNILDRLAAVGILHSSPEAAAEKASAVWHNVHDWWQSQAVQEARLLWVMRYARCGAGEQPLSTWHHTWQWFSALQSV